jgi:hypothetical protein
VTWMRGWRVGTTPSVPPVYHRSAAGSRPGARTPRPSGMSLAVARCNPGPSARYSGWLSSC